MRLLSRDSCQDGEGVGNIFQTVTEKCTISIVVSWNLVATHGFIILDYCLYIYHIEDTLSKIVDFRLKLFQSSSAVFRQNYV